MTDDQFERYKAERMKTMDALIQTIQQAIFTNPAPATGIGGWHLYKNYMRTNQRPDGSADHSRKDKMTLRFRENGALFLTYNGGSYESMYLWDYLRDRLHVGTGEGDFQKMLRVLTGIYGIGFDWDEWDKGPNGQYTNIKITPSPTMPSPAPAPEPVVEERNVWTVPADIHDRTIQPRDNTLQTFLNTIFDELVVEGVFAEYGVGIALDGSPIFWKIDKDSIIRNGKIMRYARDGHRDKSAKNSIQFVSGLLPMPDDTVAIDTMFGENLLPKYSQVPQRDGTLKDYPIGLVESEKTAIVMTCAEPSYLWMATGGINKKS